MKRWQLWLLRFLGIDLYLVSELRPVRDMIDRESDQRSAELESQRAQIEKLRRLAVVQEKPKAKVQAASFREVRQFIGEDDDSR